MLLIGCDHNVQLCACTKVLLYDKTFLSGVFETVKNEVSVDKIGIIDQLMTQSTVQKHGNEL